VTTVTVTAARRPASDGKLRETKEGPTMADPATEAFLAHRNLLFTVA
jgi:hypothetical protein